VTDVVQHLLTIFSSALECASPEEQRAYLDRACAGNPECRVRVEALLCAHEQAGNFLQGQQPTTAPGSPGGDTVAGEIAGVAIGPYRLVQELGEGGMGTVWLAEQQEPVQRQVALKVIKPGMDSKQVIARFEAERQALALMDHPNIARVFDAGTTVNGRPYFVMELVQGVPLTRYCDEQRLTPRQRLELFVPVCQAVQHAHQKGIIHRDLKPSNVLVTLYDGKPVPKVIDFGIAKATGQVPSEHSVFTQVGQVVGTLEYMSPEQAELNPLDIDTRSDVYSLGVILYELLTGSTPLERKRVRQAAMVEALRLIREEEPPTPSARLSKTDELPAVAAKRGLEPKKLSGLVRGELDWIALKALEKDRNRRYDSASGLAQDIERYLGDEPVQACPPSAWYRFRKFARRNRAALATAAVVALALLTALVALAIGELRFRAEQHDKWIAERQRGDAQEQEAIKERQRAEASEGWRRTAYFRQIALALGEYRSNNLVRASEMLGDKHCPGDLRHWEWHYLERLCRSDLDTVSLGGPDALLNAAFSPDGGRVALSFGGLVRIHDTGTGEELLTLDRRLGPMADVAFSPDGRTLATPAWSATDTEVCLWDADTGRHLLALSGLKRAQGFQMKTAAFSPDGTRLAGTDNRGNLFVWELPGGEELFRAAAFQPAVHAARAAFSPNGTRVATASPGDAVVRVWDSTTGSLLLSLEQGTGCAEVLFSPGGRWLAAAGYRDPTVRVWDAKTGRLRHVFPGSHTCLAFSPDESRLATASGGTLTRRGLVGVVRATGNTAVTVWDLATAEEIATYRGHAGPILSVHFSPDGRRIRSLDYDRVVKCWDATQAPEARVLNGRSRGAVHAAFSPDGKLVAVAGRDGVVRLFDAATGAELHALRDDPGALPNMVAFSPDGALLAVASCGVRVWETRTARLVRTLPDQPLALRPPCDAVAFSPDGTRIVSGAQDRVVRIWDTSTGQELMALPGHCKTITELAFSRDGRRLLSASGGYNRLAPGVAALDPLHLPGDLPDGPWDLKVWDLPAGTEVFSRTLPVPGGTSVPGVAGAFLPGVLALSPNGEAVALAAPDGTVRLWDVQGAEMRVLRGHSHPVYALAFSPDGQRLLGGTREGEPALRLWDVETAAEIIAFGGRLGVLNSICFSADGHKVVTASESDVRIWDATPPKR
jgi:WD40 repeat protein/serine/threonine protein kinase